MQSFQWDKNFETGMREVDEQHLYLVELVNKFGHLIAQNNFSAQDGEQVLKELTDYTVYHFQEEEMMMREKGIAKEHFDKHRQSHQQFVQDLADIAQTAASQNEGRCKQLFEFLTSWLVYHILGSDQNMARQINAIEQGVDARQAYYQEEHEHDEAVGPLLRSLNTLFEQVSERNKELMLLNQSLEDMVRQRTEQLSLANKKLEKLSFTDALTQLPNRRFAMREIQQQWLRTLEEQQSLSCMLIDVDLFKEVNDTCGHDAGDDVLKILSGTLVDNFRAMDTVCRLGGDEFLVICPELELEQAMELAQSVLSQVRDIRMQYEGYCWEGSISVGVAERDDSTSGVGDIIKFADESVYLVKDAGKNCVKAVQLG